MGQTNWRISQNFTDWATDIEKRLMHEERRPTPTARSLLGPGIAMTSGRLLDWNDAVATVNGFWWSSPGALNTPDATDTTLSGKYWMGRSQADGTSGFGVQWCAEFRPPPDGTGEITTDDMPWPQTTWMRRWYQPLDGSARTWSDWMQGADGGGGGGGSDEVWIGPDEPADPQIELWYDTDASAPLAGGNAFAFPQATPATVWTIVHPLAFTPNVTVVDSAGSQVEGDVRYTAADTVTITFSAAFTGTAYLS